MGQSINLKQAKSLVLLTAGLVMTITWAVGASGWTERLNIITLVGLGSIVIGLMLVRSLLPALVAHLFSILIGIGWSFWVTSRLLPADYTWIERWNDLAGRLNSWYNTAIQGGTSYDNLMFILQMGVIVWCVNYLTFWFIFRSGRVWQAIVPGGVVLLMNLYYAPSDITFWFLIYLMLALLLVIRFNLFKQEAKWRAERVFFRPDVSFDFLRDGFIFSALVIAIAWLAPPIVDVKALGLFDEFQGGWHDLQGEWNRLYADLNYRDTTGLVGTFGQSFTLGGPRFLTDQPVMDVKVGGEGRYWRAVVYDEYNGAGWRNTSQDAITFGPDEPASLPVFAARQPITQSFTFYQDGSTTLYALGNVISLDRSARITFKALTGEEIASTPQPVWTTLESPLVEDITYIRSDAAIDRGESYQVTSAVSRASISDLQRAGNDYPVWVTDRYLQTPPLTDRTLQLARELTDPFDNAYDKAQAVERYLRTNIKYNERIDSPPSGVDRVDYILFELQEAYCDYYATAMIMMLRSVGIPARMAAGFAQGTYDPERNVFHVINADAHSWVEVYFPNYGWIEFEPTAAQPSIPRPAGSSGNTGALPGIRPNLSELPNGQNLSELNRANNIPIDEEAFVGGSLFELPWFNQEASLVGALIGRGVLLAGILSLITLAAGALWWQRQQIYATKNIFNLYEGLIRLARWMGTNLYPWQTPYEHAAILQRRLPAYQQEVETIANDYVYQTFSSSNGALNSTGTTLTHESAVAWQRLRSHMLKTALKRMVMWRRR